MLPKRPKRSNFIEFYKIDTVDGRKGSTQGGNSDRPIAVTHKWRKLRPPCLEESITAVAGKVGTASSRRLRMFNFQSSIRPSGDRRNFSYVYS